MKTIAAAVLMISLLATIPVWIGSGPVQADQEPPLASPPDRVNGRDMGGGAKRSDGSATVAASAVAGNSSADSGKSGLAKLVAQPLDDQKRGQAMERALRAELPSNSRDKVSITVTNQTATLKGKVGSSESAQRLVERVASVPGIVAVRNRLIVTRNRDLEIATNLRDALSRDPITRSWAIAVSVFQGVVFLSGTALSEDERTRAVELAGSVVGVSKVSNGLQVPQAGRHGVRFPNRPVPTSKTNLRPR